MSADARQIGGQHYTAPAGFQHWDYVLGALRGRYLEGNITKYVCRHRKKNGLQDLEKAQHYLDKLEEAVKSGMVTPNDHIDGFYPVGEFISENGLNTAEAYICNRLAYWYRPDHLHSVRQNLNELMVDARAQQNREDGIKAGASYVNQG